MQVMKLQRCCQMEVLDSNGEPAQDDDGSRSMRMDGEATAAVRDELRKLSGLLAEDGEIRPFVIVAGEDKRVIAGNRPLFELLGCHQPDILGGPWSTAMPEPGLCDADGCFWTTLYSPRRPTDDRGISVLVDVRPIVAPGGRVVAHTLLLYPAPDRSM